MPSRLGTAQYFSFVMVSLVLWNTYLLPAGVSYRPQDFLHKGPRLGGKTAHLGEALLSARDMGVCAG